MLKKLYAFIVLKEFHREAQPTQRRPTTQALFTSSLPEPTAALDSVQTAVNLANVKTSAFLPVATQLRFFDFVQS